MQRSAAKLFHQRSPLSTAHHITATDAPLLTPPLTSARRQHSQQPVNSSFIPASTKQQLHPCGWPTCMCETNLFHVDLLVCPCVLLVLVPPLTPTRQSQHPNLHPNHPNSPHRSHNRSRSRNRNRSRSLKQRHPSLLLLQLLSLGPHPAHRQSPIQSQSPHRHLLQNHQVGFTPASAHISFSGANSTLQL